MSEEQFWLGLLVLWLPVWLACFWAGVGMGAWLVLRFGGRA